MIGCDGACMLLGNIAPALCMDIVSAGFRGDYATAVELQRVASKLNVTVMNTNWRAEDRFGNALATNTATRGRPTATVTNDSKAAIEAVLWESGLLA